MVKNLDNHIKNVKKEIGDIPKRETKRHGLIKYIGLLIILISYFVFVSIKFGTQDGIWVMLLTWSFFVFCTPVADAGFLLDFPIRLLTNLRMIYSEIIVWGIALILNLYAFFFLKEIYSKTLILNLFYHILEQPIPYWAIILVSGLGTFFSIYFGDELIDVISHKKRDKYHKHINKYQIIVFVFIIVFIIILYDFLLKNIGVNIPL